MSTHKTCPQCGIYFNDARYTFCSIECVERDRLNEPRFNEYSLCRSCGAQFKRRVLEHKFCSKTCSNNFHNPRKTPERALCANCAEPFRPYRPSSRFCSKDCRIRYYTMKRRLKHLGKR